MFLLKKFFVCSLIALPTSVEDYENDLSADFERATRGVKWDPIGKITAKIVGNAITYSAVALGVNQIQKQLDKSDTPSLVREPFKCETNNYGCLHGNCWTNCGPRLQSSDYCLTTNGTLEKTAQLNIEKINPDIHNGNYGLVVSSQINTSLFHFIPFAKCVTKLECNPCFECAGVCLSENNVAPLSLETTSIEA